MTVINYFSLAKYNLKIKIFILAAIEELPLVNSPEVFGLHANAEIGYYTQSAKEMWANLVELQPQTGKRLI